MCEALMLRSNECASTNVAKQRMSTTNEIKNLLFYLLKKSSEISFLSLFNFSFLSENVS
jgi:hypothetical protein